MPFLCACLLPGWSLAGEGRRILDGIREHFESAACWEIRFRHDFVWVLAGDSVSVEGLLVYRRDGAFRVDLGAAHMLSDGGRLWRWEDGGRQVLLERPGESEDVILPHQLLLHLDERFRAGEPRECGEDEDRRVELELSPRGDSEFMQRILLELGLEGRALLPRALSFNDIGGNRNRYTVLSRDSWTGGCPDERAAGLEFRLPEGYELIDLRAGGSADETR